MNMIGIGISHNFCISKNFLLFSSHYKNHSSITGCAKIARGLDLACGPQWAEPSCSKPKLVNRMMFTPLFTWARWAFWFNLFSCTFWKSWEKTNLVNLPIPQYAVKSYQVNYTFPSQFGPLLKITENVFSNSSQIFYSGLSYGNNLYVHIFVWK